MIREMHLLISASNSSSIALLDVALLKDKLFAILDVMEDGLGLPCSISCIGEVPFSSLQFLSPKVWKPKLSIPMLELMKLAAKTASS